MLSLSLFLQKPTGIYRKLVRVFLVQMVFISAVTLLGVYVAALVVEKVMIQAALESEAEHFWALHRLNPDQATPNTDNLLGFLVENDQKDHLPTVLQGLAPGLHRQPFAGSEPIIYVEMQGDYCLYLVFDEPSVTGLSFYFGVVPLSLALIVIYVSAWFAYRSSVHSVSPLVSLAQTMQQFNWGEDDLSTLSFDRYTHLRAGDEVNVLAEALKAFTERLQYQLEREQAFTRDVSHELRTPLAVIQGSLAFLEKTGGFDERQQRALSRMRSTSNDMLSLIETLLLLAREQQKAKEGPQSGVLLQGLLQSLIEQINSTSNADQHVCFVIANDDDLRIQAPAQAVGVVLGNLLRNACNYSLEGVVRVDWQGTQVRVTDAGQGMSDHEQQRVQAPFVRGNVSVSGHGLGLDIVRRLCERYGWQLSIRSVQSGGTRVSVDFHDSVLPAGEA